MNDYKLMNIYDLEEFVEDIMIEGDRGILFCFGTSFISKLIKAKTAKYPSEIVPSHVALMSNKFIYESTTSESVVDNKKIKSGVRRWLLKDFIKAEKSRLTKYCYISHKWSYDIADEFIHLPYGKDIILEFLLKDGSEGDSKGLICSQYANKCIEYPLKKACPTPAEMFRVEKGRYNLNIVE